MSAPSSNGPPWRTGLLVAAAGLCAGWLGSCGRFDAEKWNGAWDESWARAAADNAGSKNRPPLAVEWRHGGDRLLAPQAGPDPWPVMMACFVKEEASQYHEWPPGPLDVAVLLKTLQTKDPGLVALAIPPVWAVPAEGTLATKALASACGALNAIPVVAAFEPAQSAVAAPEAEAFFHSVPSIPLAKVRGDASGIPLLNDPGPPPVPGFPTSDLAFGRVLLLQSQEWSEGLRISIPLLARTSDGLLPALPLVAWARRHGLNPAEADVIPGDSIRLGGTSIPIDAGGRLSVPLAGLDRLRACTVLDLTQEKDAPEVKGLAVVAGHAGQASVPLPGGRTADPAKLAALVLGVLETGEFARPVVRLSAPAAIVSFLVLLGLAGSAAASLWLPRPWRITAAVLVAATWGLSAVAWVRSGAFPAFAGPTLAAATSFGLALWCRGVVAVPRPKKTEKTPETGCAPPSAANPLPEAEKPGEAPPPGPPDVQEAPPGGPAPVVAAPPAASSRPKGKQAGKKGKKGKKKR